MRAVRAGLIGYGAISAEVVARVKELQEVRVEQVLVRRARLLTTAQSLGPETQVISDAEGFDPGLDVILEVAGHEALTAYGTQVLSTGIDLCVASVGALADDQLRASLVAAAGMSGARLELLPGAIGGIDALNAAGSAGLDRVTYEGRKPPMAWTGTPAEATCDLTTLNTETVIFRGIARDAARTFPKNANVVATVALAGAGLDATDVRLIADPSATGNSHRIEARGPLVELDYTTRGKPLPSNPKTSALTALSAVRALRNRTGPICL
ncbi:MAG: aspartate dehydrogenase [Pseudomonadota bacterium]